MKLKHHIYTLYKKNSLLFIIVCILVFCMSAVAVLAVQLNSSEVACSTTPTRPVPEIPGLNTEESTFIELLNECRALNNRPQLIVDTHLVQAASWMSNDLRQRNTQLGANPPGGYYCDHTDTLGRTPVDRMVAYGYPANNAVGENIGCGFRTAKDMMQGWLDSPGHHSNMLFYYWAKVGVSQVVNTTPYGFPVYWTLDLADCYTNCSLNTVPTPTNTPTPTNAPQGLPTPTLTLTPTTTPTYTPTPTQSPATIDTVPPTLTISSPQNNAIIGKYTIAQLAATASDASGVKLLTIAVDGKIIKSCPNNPAKCIAYYKFPTGKHTVIFTATDNAKHANIATQRVTITKQ